MEATELKSHLSREHGVIEASEGMTVSDDQIVYGPRRSLSVIEGIHELEHRERGHELSHTHHAS